MSKTPTKTTPRLPDPAPATASTGQPPLSTRPGTLPDTVVGGHAGTTETAPGPIDKADQAAATAAAVSASGRPAAAASAAEDVRGSAREAPGVGSGPAAIADPRAPIVDPVAVAAGAAPGVAPGIYSKEGAFGSAPEQLGADQAAAAALRGFAIPAGVVRSDVERHFAARLDDHYGRPALAGGGMAAVSHGDLGMVGDRQILGPDGGPAVRITRGFDLRITARRDGFRRGGIAHPSTPTERRSTDFTAAELRQIRNEPMLFVEELD